AEPISLRRPVTQFPEELLVRRQTQLEDRMGPCPAPWRGPMSHDPPTSMTPVGEQEVRLTDPTDRQVIRGRLLGSGFLIVGRRPNAHVVLPATDREAAVLHFDIDLQPDYCLLTNHSPQGTFVNGLLVCTQCDLEHGDLIRASQSVLLFQLLRGGAPTAL